MEHNEDAASLWGIDATIVQRITEAEASCDAPFLAVDRIRLHNQAKVLAAFQANRVAYAHFQPSSGYGYGDIGRDTLEKVFAQALGCEDALVRPQIMSGTHALSLALSALLTPGQTLLSVSGKPYDTLEGVIGIRPQPGSLAEYGVAYRQVDLLPGGAFDRSAIMEALRDSSVHVVAIQRSRGYDWRPSLRTVDMLDIMAEIRQARQDVMILVDNCYGEFVECDEPSQADVLVGSLIKNPGGGIAPTGGYIAGRAAAIERISFRLSAPGVGREIGSYAAMYTPFFQGLFLAPRTVADSMKVAILAAEVFAGLGYDVLPKAGESQRADIIESIAFGDAARLIAFCQGVQAGAPVDAFAAPEPWDMPGYAHPVIMAAGTFVQGASIEMSADAPMKEPYIAYLQGALTYDHGKIALMIAMQHMQKQGVLMSGHR